MNYTPSQIEAAVNAAEQVALRTYPDSQPITVTNGTLITLIEAAKQGGEVVNKAQEELDELRSKLRSL